MKKSFAAKRKPRVIGADEADDSPTAENQGSVVKRPNLQPKTKKRSSLRLSFGPGASQGQDAGEDGSTVFTPKKSNLNRFAVEKNAEKHALNHSSSAEYLPFRAGLTQDRPSYSKDYITELKNSTPSTPKQVDSGNVSANEESNEPGVVSKYGSSLKSSLYENPAIPSEAEIREKKARRARMAKENEFLSLNGEDAKEDADALSDDSEFRDRNQDFMLLDKNKEPESRLVREDEDMAEGFDEYVEDGGISLGKRAEREAQKKRREEMASLIADAEGNSDESDESEAERNAAYEFAQTQAGTYGTRSGENNSTSQRPRTPPKMAPVPELSTILQRLKAGLRTMEETKARKLKLLEGLRVEKLELAEQETFIQSQLKETGEKYEKLRLEAGIGSGGSATPLSGTEGGRLVVSRGLESLVATPITTFSEDSDR